MGTTYRHLGDVTGMFAAQEQFRDITKMVCARLRGLTKTYNLGNANKMVTKRHQFVDVTKMVMSLTFEAGKVELIRKNGLF